MTALTRTRLAAAAVTLAVGTTLLTGCGADEDPAAELACGLIDPSVVDQAAAGRAWHAVGSLNSGDNLGDICSVMVGSAQLLGITLTDFDAGHTGDNAHKVVMGERTYLTKNCPQTKQGPAGADQATSQCVSKDAIRYAVTNPKRLVRVSLDRQPDSVPTMDAVVKVAASINQNADKLGL